LIKRALLVVFFGGCLIAAGLALSPSQNVIIMQSHKNAGNIHPPIPTNTALPTVSGTAQVGQTLTGTNGTWTNNPTSYRYMWTWEDCGTDNTRTSISTVALTTDIGHQLCFSVWASNASGESVRVEAALTATVTQPIAGRVIFSDYLVYEWLYNSPSPALGDVNDIAAHKLTIQAAQAAGVDGFQWDYYNDGNTGPLQFNVMSNMLEAAKELHAANPSQPPFLFYLAPDLGGGGAAATYASTGRYWVEYFLASFYTHPNYFYYNSKPVLGSFMGLQDQPSLTTVFTALANEGIHPFYVPSVNNAAQVTTDGTHFTPWAQTYIGSLHIWTGNTPTNDVGGTNAIVAVNAANSVPNVIGVAVAPYMDTHSGGNAPYREHYGGEGPDTEYTNAIPQNPVFIIESPWNDLAESYSSNIDVTLPTVSSGYPYDNLHRQHKGYSEIRKYYKQWFTTGVKPTITQDFLAYFYRVCPYAACSNGGLQPPPWNVFGVTPIDDVYVTCDLVSPATLQINTGGTITTYSLGPGRNLVHTPFTPGTTQNFQIIRNGVQVASVSGEPIIANPTQNNLQSTSGFVYGGNVSPVPVNTGGSNLPTVSGTAQVGQTLTGTVGTWTNNPTSYTYMWTWEDCGTDNTRTGTITALTTTTVPLTTDIGHQLCFSVWANNASGQSVRVEAALTATVTAATAF
jgi:hypothetical protein